MSKVYLYTVGIEGGDGGGEDIKVNSIAIIVGVTLALFVIGLVTCVAVLTYVGRRRKGGQVKICISNIIQ